MLADELRDRAMLSTPDPLRDRLRAGYKRYKNRLGRRAMGEREWIGTMLDRLVDADLTIEGERFSVERDTVADDDVYTPTRWPMPADHEPEDQSQRGAGDDGYRAEYAANRAIFASMGVTEAEYIFSKKIDDGSEQL